ncbi:hypothetical protein YC2023_055922 [Brassica napus]
MSIGSKSSKRAAKKPAAESDGSHPQLFTKKLFAAESSRRRSSKPTPNRRLRLGVRRETATTMIRPRRWSRTETVAICSKSSTEAAEAISGIGVCTVRFSRQEKNLRHSRRESAESCDAPGKDKNFLAFGRCHGSQLVQAPNSLARASSCKVQFREESSDDEPNHPVASSSRRCGNHASDFEADKKNKREHGEVSHHLIAKRGAFREKPKTKVTSFSSEKTSAAVSLELELSVQSLQSAHQLVGDRDLGDAILHRTLVQFCISGPENFKGTSFMSKKSSPVESIELELPAQTKPQSQSQYKL